jgi:lysophospholipase L1-like esterase
LQMGSVLAAGALVLVAMLTVLRGVSRRNVVLRNIVPGFVICVPVAAAIAGGAELYFRINGMFPAAHTAWSTKFEPGVGFLHEPGKEVRWTNGLDFWIKQPANSLGFLDWEPAIPKPKGIYRILLVGDSMVEAAQVPLEQKLQAVLVELLRKKMPSRKVDVVALGYSGSGQSNQLAYYERFKKDLEPDLVVLLFVGNDFSNNSPLLEAVRQGWDPEHPPWLFHRRNPDGSCSRIPISSEWERYRLPGGTPEVRAAQFQQLSPEYRAKLDGWDTSNGKAALLDFVFHEPGEIPPAFEEAVELTKCAFAEWQRETAADGLPLIVVAHEQVTAPWQKTRGQVARLRAILEELRIPLLDLYPINVKRGDMTELRFKHDGHWTALGHRWAAEAIFDFLNSGGYLQPQAVRAAR